MKYARTVMTYGLLCCVMFYMGTIIVESMTLTPDAWLNIMQYITTVVYNFQEHANMKF